MDNVHIVLQSRPGVNCAPRYESFSPQLCPEPVLKANDVIIQTLYLSVDPAMRCRMNEETGVDYVTPWEVGETIEGFGGVGKVIESSSPDYVPGCVVESQIGWPWLSRFSVQDCSPGFQLALQKVDENLVLDGALALPLTLLGLTGLTAYCGLTERAKIRFGDSCVVSGAAGSTGSIAGQVARLLGCSTVVGICGTDEKCRVLVEELGFSAAINYRSDDVKSKLEEASPRGIDLYFDNVGGDISETVLQQMNEGARIVLCGQISQYNKDVEYPPPLPQQSMELIQKRQIFRERYLVLGSRDAWPAAVARLTAWWREGRLKVKQTEYEGLRNAGPAFVDMMNGCNIGKMVVRVG